MVTILEFMESLGVSYSEPNSAWADFHRWYQKMPVDERPSVCLGDSNRKFIVPRGKGRV